MPNSYTAVPSIIPGNLAVQGGLTTTGNIVTNATGVATVEAGTPAANSARHSRINYSGAGGDSLTFNLAGDLVTRDSVILPAYALVYDPTALKLFWRLVNAAGNAMDVSPRMTLFSDLNLTQHVGDTVETTIKSKLVRAGVIPSGGLVRVRFQFSGIAQGATPSTVRVKWGANVIDSFTVATLTSYAYEAYIGWPGSTAIAQFYSIRTQITGAVTSATGGPNADIATDQTFAITFQAGANTDNGAIQMAGLDLLTTFSPV